MIEAITRFNLGNKGSQLLDYIIANPYYFVLIVFLYGSISMYARYNFKVLLPKKMKEIIAENPKDTFKQLFEKWEKSKEEYPWYILVPTKHELWFKPLKKSNGVYQLMTEKKSTTEKEMMEEMYRDIRKPNKGKRRVRKSSR